MTDLPVAVTTYLEAVPQLGSGWLEGGGRVSGLAPGPSVCVAARALLTALATDGVDLAFGPFLIGPLPSGGLGMDFRHDGRCGILHLHNTGAAELAVGVESDLNWEEWEFPATEALDQIRRRLFASRHSS